MQELPVGHPKTLQLLTGFLPFSLSPTTSLVLPQQISALFQLLVGKAAKLPALHFLVIAPSRGAGLSIPLPAI